MTRPLDSSNSLNSISSANYQNRASFPPSDGGVVSTYPAFGMLNEQYNWGSVVGGAIAWTGFNTAWDIGKSSLEAKKFHVPRWIGTGAGAAGAMFGALVAGGLLEAWRSNDAKHKNQDLIKSLQAPSRPNPFNTSTQA
ncbi:MAG: hypothetical protein NTW61_01375 [Candidatus Melainabacteria bacterium]|nr:hypothetical protein [Candidatus Melainabacteria bacterium]